MFSLQIHRATADLIEAFQDAVLRTNDPRPAYRTSTAPLIYQKRRDTIGEVGSSGECGEARGAGCGTRDRLGPVGEALEIDRGGGGHVL
jgi:hypothetical protein